jgi:hypothetical protein
VNGVSRCKSDEFELNHDRVRLSLSQSRQALTFWEFAVNKSSTLALLIASFLTTAVMGAMYIKFDGVDGEASKGGPKPPDCPAPADSRVSLNGLPPGQPYEAVKSPRDPASGQASGRRQHEPIRCLDAAASAKWDLKAAKK